MNTVRERAVQLCGVMTLGVCAMLVATLLGVDFRLLSGSLVAAAVVTFLVANGASALSGLIAFAVLQALAVVQVMSSRGGPPQVLVADVLLSLAVTCALIWLAMVAGRGQRRQDAAAGVT